MTAVGWGLNWVTQKYPDFLYGPIAIMVEKLNELEIIF
jgi:hypothetical protein